MIPEQKAAAAKRIAVEPLLPAEFAPFGDVLRNDGAARRNHYPDATAAGAAPGDLRFWVSRVAPLASVPPRIVQLERHPHAVQTFVPLQVSRWLIVVAPDLPGGLPDVARLRVFLAAPGQGICYRRRTWHHGALVLDAPAVFGVLMWRRAAGDDDEFYDLREPVEIGGLG